MATLKIECIGSRDTTGQDFAKTGEPFTDRVRSIVDAVDSAASDAKRNARMGGGSYYRVSRGAQPVVAFWTDGATVKAHEGSDAARRLAETFRR